MNFELCRKKALVTGSSAGIGLAIAVNLAKEGAEVIITARSKAVADKAMAQITKEASNAVVHACVGDLSKIDTINALTNEHPTVDILVNNLGIYYPKSFDEISDQEWYDIFETNFFSGMRLSRFYLKKMLKQDWGRVIFISSESAVQIPVEMIHYGVTKTMQVALSRGLAESTKGTNVTVNTVLAGPTRSHGVEQLMEGIAKQQNKSFADVEKDFFLNLRPSSLLQRFTSPAEVANLVTYVASPLSSATNGAALRADGGVVRAVL